MRKRSVAVLVATAALTIVAARSAVAADLSPPIYKALPPPAFSWTGWYVGVNGGGEWGQTSHTASVGVTGLPALTTGNFNVSGAIAGGTLGYNYQMGQWLVGVETDLNWTNEKATYNTNLTVGAATGSASLSSQLNWLDTTRVRVGWAWDRVLFYGTGGGAFGGLTATANASAAVSGVGAAVTAADTQTRFGWTAGAGIEYAFANNLSGKVEYLYVDLGSQNELLVDSVKFKTNMVRAGLNLRF